MTELSSQPGRCLVARRRVTSCSKCKRGEIDLSSNVIHLMTRQSQSVSAATRLNWCPDDSYICILLLTDVMLILCNILKRATTPVSPKWTPSTAVQWIEKCQLTNNNRLTWLLTHNSALWLQSFIYLHVRDTMFSPLHCARLYSSSPLSVTLKREERNEMNREIYIGLVPWHGAARCLCHTQLNKF